ncbi:PorP/SprF family type IX secretion system membrane protein [Changchengzhania lutea]|uniref:PorP/SprF family type IX secretion system membrane protein n=1 Tax=Changchengzhania lutea TaxID=2049305 RepID=UPI00115F59F2|nr:PorP/SprF family type IX secretion system membrane protein [Changchengzhania lutea]
MKKHVLHIVLFFSLVQLSFSQENGVVAFNLPVRNSLKFNKYVINPTFSFVREQNKYVSFSNKRQWVQFDDAPQTYLFSYAGRFRENAGIGVGVFQQDYGVLTTFGGVLNYAYNAVLNRDSNLTFGVNLGFYKSGVNEGKVITNFPDPSLETIPSNSLITINPGINYGTTFFDFGLAFNNIVQYNLQTSRIIEENPEQSIQAHMMYTGYFDSRGFFDESKFSGLVRSEFKKEQTVISGLVMLTIPKGIWAQLGYNTLYGASAGVGLNISTQIAMEYNYEKLLGDFAAFGNSHEITLAYKFKKRNRYNYSDDDEEQALIIPAKRKRRPVASRKSPTKSITKARSKPVANNDSQTDAQAKTDQEAQAKLLAEAQAKKDENAQAEQLANAQAKEDEEAKLLAEVKAKEEQEAKAKLLAEAQSKATEETQAKLLAEAQAKADEEARAKLLAEKQAKANEEAKVKLLVEAQAKADEEAQAKLLAEQEAKLLAEAQVKENSAPTDAATISLDNLAKSTEESKLLQQQLLTKLSETVASKEQDLKDLKEENDLSEQGIFKAPKPFKSLTAENAALESLTLEIDNVIIAQNNKIKELENLYAERLKTVSNVNDATNAFYQNSIQVLKSEQMVAMQSKQTLMTTLEEIKVATEFERKRRIKRAAYDNEEDRYLKDKSTLNQITQNTPTSNVPLQEEDFDFGETQKNIQIVKDIKNVDSGYYVVLAVHTDMDKRDEFLRKTVSTGEKDINFFYDVNTSKYYIYQEKYDDISSAKRAIESNGDAPYKSKMSLVKIEN